MADALCFSRMSEPAAEKLEQKNEWTLSPSALGRLLKWLDDGVESEGQRYLEMSRRLLAYFDRRGCSAADELADETLNRVARRLEEEGRIESETPAKYCYIVARFVFLEHLRATQKSNLMLGEMRQTGDLTQASPTAAALAKEKMLDCLERCVSELEPSNRDLITRYYVGKERIKIDNRRSLAESLGITTNALSIRACRIRDKLEACVRRCVNEAK
jgi:DNA-directed RNA polymerase specialized sigma24 family protein